MLRSLEIGLISCLFLLSKGLAKGITITRISDAVPSTQKRMARNVRVSGDGESIVEAAEASGLITLVRAVADADLTDTLQSSGPFTVFAPTDAAFEDISAAEPQLLNLLFNSPYFHLHLKQLLLHHVAIGNVGSADLKDGQVISMLDEEEVIVSLEDGVSITDASGDVSYVTSPDVPATNGVVHIIDGVLMPSLFTKTHTDYVTDVGNFSIFQQAVARLGLSAYEGAFDIPGYGLVGVSKI